jgi:hypothetical protein
MRHSPPARITARRVATAIALSAIFTLSASAIPATAQQVSGGATATLAAAFVRGVDTAADSSGNYLAVGGQGTLLGVCINAGGAAISGAMTINASAGGYASFPRAVYIGSGSFLVVWAEAPGNPDAMRQLFARVVNCSGGVGAARVVTTAVWWEPGNLGIAYSPSSQRAFVAWQTPEHTVRGSLVDTNGSPVGSIVNLSSGMGRDPSVTWNSQTNDFGVSFSGETYSAFAVVPPANPAAFNRNTFNVSGGILTTMTDVAFNPGTLHHVLVRAVERSARTRGRVRLGRKPPDAGDGVIAVGFVRRLLHGLQPDQRHFRHDRREPRQRYGARSRAERARVPIQR